jgi:hypothetical protein
MKNSYLARRFEESFKKNIEDLPLAYIWDRLAAFAVDLILLSFVANVALAPLRKKMQAAILNEHDGAINLYIFCIVVSVCAMFIAYQTVSVFFYKKTIGKKIFNLEVAPILHGQEIDILHCFVRACSLLVSIILFCFPLLEVFSNRLRRPMHDKLSDTYVKGTVKTGTSPSSVEKLWVRLVYLVVVTNIAVIAIAQVFFFKEDIQNLSEFVTKPEYLCDAVSEAKESWPKKDKVSRLDIALTLYGTESVNEECLDKEAQRAVSYGEELEKAYLAKAFVYENKTEISDQYLQKVCDLNSKSEACLLSQMISLWSEKDWKSADIILDNMEIKTPFLKVWAIKHFDKIQSYNKLLALTDSLWPNKSLNDFIGKYKTLTLWNLNKTNESKELFQSTYAYLPDDKKMSFLSDVCNLEIEKGCAVNEFNGCKLLVDKMKNETMEAVPEETLITYIKTNKCGMTKVEDIITEYRDSIDDPKIEMYLAALRAQNLGKNSVAEQIYKNILRTPGAPSLLTYEVRSNLIEMIDDKDFLEQVDWWVSSDAVGSYHQQLGSKFLKLLAEKKKWDIAEPIAQKLLSSSFRTQEENELMTVVFYNLKKFSVARKIIEAIEKNKSRAIASQNNFDEIKKELLNSVKSNEVK